MKKSWGSGGISRPHAANRVKNTQKLLQNATITRISNMYITLLKIWIKKGTSGLNDGRPSENIENKHNAELQRADPGTKVTG